MAEYIDRDALKKQMASFVPFVIDASNQAYADGLTDAYSLICQAPAADVVERKTGTWKDGGKSAFFPEHGIYCCSECDRHYFTKFRFCPHCGAQMIGGDEDV